MRALPHISRAGSSPAVLFFLVCHAGSTASGQTLLHTFDGNSAGDLFGTSVSAAGDVDGDGRGDLIVGASHDDAGGQTSGSARVLSGADGGTVHTFIGDSPFDRFGRSVSGAGDLNGDGFDDLIVGAYFDDNNGSNSGSARVFSGASGGVLYTFDGDSTGDALGWSVSGVGDVNGDGHDDVIAGARDDDNNGPDSGSARVYSGATGFVVYTFEGDSAGDNFGVAVSGAGDVNGDGFDDLIVGAHHDDTGGVDSGSARVFSGRTGSTLYTFHGDSAGDGFGGSVSGAGDVNGDGFDDVIVGADLDDNNGSQSGSARVFSGIDGSVLYTFEGGSPFDHFGFAVGGAGDVDGDGKSDLVVGAYGDDGGGPDAGSVRVLSGQDGHTIHIVHGDSPDDRLGSSVSGAGDVDGDGKSDFVVGAPEDDDGGSSSGSARVFSGHRIGSRYCDPALPNSSGAPGVLAATGSALVVNNDLTLRADQLPAGQFGYFLAGQTQGSSMPPGSQGLLCLTAAIARFDGAGQIIQGPSGSTRLNLNSFPLTPPQAVQPGETWNFQAWFRDVGGTSNFTDAVAVVFE